MAKLISAPLSADSAVQVALVNSPALQAVFEDLSLAQADVVQAGLLSNPVLSVDYTAAERESLDPNLIAGLTLNFLDLVLIPLRTKVAHAQFEAAKFRVGSSVLETAAQVKRAFYTVQAAEQVLDVRRTIAAAEQGVYELAQGQAAAGNTNDLALASQKMLYLQAQVDVIRAEADAAAAGEELTRLLGLPDVSWRAERRLRDVPASDISAESLEERALRDRLELAAFRQEAQALRDALDVAKTSRWTGVLDIGADVARLKDGRVAVGPRASLELPIFDQRQASIARLEAQLAVTEDMLAAAVVDARSEVRAARDRVVYARRIAEQYRTSILPTREELVAISQEQYNAMLLGVYPLVAAKESEAGAYCEYVHIVRDYWIARADLERAIGGARIVDASARTSPVPPSSPAAAPSKAPPAPPPSPSSPSSPVPTPSPPSPSDSPQDHAHPT
jgi:cobalt-zinc-cadmium efflux system outer membrane protein